MLFAFSCEKCGNRVESDYRIGQAPRTVPCPKCGGTARRLYEACAFVLNGSGWPSKAIRTKGQQTRANEAAGERMRREHKAPKLVAQ